MRRLLWILLFFAILWCAWWAVFGWGLKSALDTWFEDRRSQGWQADYASMDLRGFPTRVSADMVDIVLADTHSGVVVNLPSLSLSAPTHWPGDVSLTLPSEPIEFVAPQNRAALQIAGGIADLKLHPGVALELEAVSASAGEWSITSNDRSVLAASTLTLVMQQSEASPNLYDVSVNAVDLRPGEVPRSALRLPDSWPVAFDTFELDATVEFDKPWDISAIETARPQPRNIKLELAEAAWSDLRLFFAADLQIDAAGIPTGTINVQAENWRVMLDLAERVELLPSALREQAEAGINALARFSGDKTALDVQVNLRGGMIFVGFIPVGQAPAIILR